MMNEKQAKSFLNYVAENKLSSDYEIIPFFDMQKTLTTEVNAELLKNVNENIEFVCRQFAHCNFHVYRKINSIPLSLKKVGYLVQNADYSEKFYCGREYELDKMNVVLHKQIKNNVLLVGLHGVGKTSTVFEYAKKFKVKNIFVVESAKLIGDTEYRGQFEKRVVELVEFAKWANYILFFDEIHSLLNLGKAQGGISITDILKPYLQDRRLRFIGATTLSEAKLLLADEAFKRRFSTVFLDEPDDETLFCIAKSFEKNIAKSEIFSNNELCLAISTLRTKLSTRHFPDKLLDFLDMFDAKRHFSPNADWKATLSEFINDNNAL